MQHPNRPVVGVSWFDTMAYCKWAGVRLPTDAEWERARRGAEGRKYPWGNEDPDPTRANYDAGPGHPTPIGLYPAGATPEGITDMAGNVWEWPDYWNDKDETQNFRGGSWLNFESLLDSTAASGLYRAAVALSDVGFRVARDVV
jgi:formylglycine-generating enzyme required for sulfatase activity